MSRGISIVIPTHNRARLLDLTLRSLAALRVPEGLRTEILVIDNNCTDNTRDVVAAVAGECPQTIRRVEQTLQGLSHSRNCGVASAAFDVIAFFDDDVRVSQDWLFGCVEAMEQAAADCVVGPVAPAIECAVPPYVSARVVELISSPYSRKGTRMAVLPPETAHEVPGCNFAVRTEVAKSVGAFNPELGRRAGAAQSGEDFEFGQRLVRAGKRVVYHPRCSIEHFITAEKLGKKWLRMRWYGDGLFARLAYPEPAFMRSALGRARAAAGVLRLVLLSILHASVGRRAQSFEYELNARRALGYLRAR